MLSRVAGSILSRRGRPGGPEGEGFQSSGSELGRSDDGAGWGAGCAFG